MGGGNVKSADLSDGEAEKLTKNESANVLEEFASNYFVLFGFNIYA